MVSTNNFFLKIKFYHGYIYIYIYIYIKYLYNKGHSLSSKRFCAV